eukprot:TRINITY_DN22929_c0_g1_i2.p1 TRINITY_DN22929_c0_g1~~TRINITY_DN22929_c0_g1_i2.p1  ORF type:complete len:144 (-),score=17.07 TRINITY_DN22929_c0_g1_i2:213-644(-)
MYVLCPMLCGLMPNPEFTSTYDNAGIWLDYPEHAGPKRITKNAITTEEGERLHDTKNCLAWPGYATVEDLADVVPRCVVVVNEFDPFRDEGIELYRKCLEAGVEAQCVTLHGTIHGIGSYLLNVCPEISREQARAMAAFVHSS